MSFDSTVFKDLMERFPTWNQLEEFLESEEGGLFRVVDQTDDLRLIRYEKGVTNMELPHSAWFRSVVWNAVTHRPVCVAPPKTTSTDLPISDWSEMTDRNLYAQPWLDGFMINAFKCVGDDALHITSRSRLDASGRFYSAKTFRHLFIESYTGYKTQVNDEIERIIQGEAKNFPSPDASRGETVVFVSFVVQHTEHRNVLPVEENRLWVVHQGTVYEDGTIRIQDSPPAPPLTRWNQIESLPLPSSGCITSWMQEQFQTCPQAVSGIVIKDTQGQRWKVASDAFRMVQSLRGNTPHSLERFVQLYAQNMVPMYLQYYPEDYISFSLHHECMNELVKQLYQEYRNLHVYHSVSLTDVDKMFHPHLYAIHGHYLTHLRPVKGKISANDVYDYLRKQPWQRVSFLLHRMEDEYFENIKNTLESSVSFL